ncbi:hypothetical protein SAMN04487787_107152 [Kosakonia sacchari]|nr:hypothetical protein SAMN04487787_107152 [Kosakonia sacchari]
MVKARKKLSKVKLTVQVGTETATEAIFGNIIGNNWKFKSDNSYVALRIGCFN